MEIDDILGVIFAGTALLLLIGLLFFAVLYFAKEEKEHKILINKELNARIKFYNDFIDYLRK